MAHHYWVIIIAFILIMAMIVAILVESENEKSRRMTGRPAFGRYGSRRR